MKTWIFLFCCFSTLCFAFDKLRVYEDTGEEALLQTTSNVTEITQVLNSIGVRFEQWQANQPLPEGADQAAVLEAYQEDVTRLTQENGYQSIDVVRMVPTSPKRVEMRQKFLNEHIHAEDEVRFFVEGSGLFYLHVQGNVYLVLCEKGDLISIPASYRHWFDMGVHPSFTAIRFFLTPNGWVADFTESGISKKFPQYSL